MSKISGKETKPEILVRKSLFAQGFRYRKNDKRFPGKPDIILPKYKAAIFVHGCFWHGHTCKAATLPTSNVAFWQEKIGANKARDKRNKKDLEKLGWRVINIWQCEISSKEKRTKKLTSVVKKLELCLR